jgi:ABC-type multidrug transport system fused ATPase/permease subunit
LATEKEVEDAARVANLHDFVEGLDRGYRTLLGERGITLTEGQKQRLSIARASIINPSLILMVLLFFPLILIPLNFIFLFINSPFFHSGRTHSSSGQRK